MALCNWIKGVSCDKLPCFSKLKLHNFYCIPHLGHIIFINKFIIHLHSMNQNEYVICLR